jgi:hypothetical protein
VVRVRRHVSGVDVMICACGSGGKQWPWEVTLWAAPGCPQYKPDRIEVRACSQCWPLMWAGYRWPYELSGRWLAEQQIAEEMTEDV